MAVPTVLTPGTQGAGTGAVSPGLPSGLQANDILVLVIEGEGEDTSADSPPTGGDWTAIDGSTGSVASATDGSVDRTRLSAYWHRYDGSNNPSTSVPDAGDHANARIFAFRGCRTTGSPFDVVLSGTDAVNRTAHRAFADGVTTIDDCLVVLFHGHGDDVTCTDYANAYLSSVAEIDAEVTSTAGSDSTLGAASGGKATPGTMGIWTWTTSAIEEKAWWCVALAPSSTASATDTASLDSSSNSGSLWSSSTVYDTARSGGSISSLGQSDSRVGQTFVSPNYRVGAGYLEFDLSSLPSSINVSEVLLAVKAPNYADNPTGFIYAYVHDYGTLDTGDWIDHTTWSGTAIASIDLSTWVHSEWWDFTESGTGLKDAIEAAAGGTLRLALLGSRPLAGNTPTAAEYPTIYTYDATGLGPSLHISYTEAGATVSASGAVTPTGALKRDINTLEAGAVTPAGALHNVVKRAFSGSVTPTGTHISKAKRATSGSVTPTGAFSKMPKCRPSGAVTPTGALYRVTAKFFSRIRWAVGTLTLQADKLLAGSVTPTGAHSGQAVTGETISVSGSVTPAGTTTKSTTVSSSGSLTPSGAVTRSVLLTLSGAITPTGAMSKAIYLTLEGSVTPAGATTKSVLLTVEGAIAPAGALLRKALTLEAGTVAPVGTLTLPSSLVLSGTLAPAGALSREARLVLSGAAGTAGTHRSGVLSHFAGSVAPMGLQTSSAGKLLAGTVASSGGHIASVSKNLAGLVTPVGAFSTTGRVTATAIISPSGSLALEPRIIETGLVAPTGTLLLPGLGMMGGLLTRARDITWRAAVSYLGWRNASVRVRHDWTAGPNARIFLGAVLGPTGRVLRDVALKMSGALTPTGHLLSDKTQTLSGAITPVGAMTHTPSAGPETQAVAGSVTPTSTISHLPRRTFAGAEVPSGVVTKAAARGFIGSCGSAGVTRRKVSLLLSGSITPTGVEQHPTAAPETVALAGSITPTAETLVFGPARQNLVQQLQFNVEWWNRPAASARSEYADNPSFIGSYLTNLAATPLEYHNQKIGNGNPPGSPPLQPNTTYYVRHLLTTGTGQAVTTASHAWTTAIARQSLAGGIIPVGALTRTKLGTVKTISVGGAITPAGGLTPVELTYYTPPAPSGGDDSSALQTFLNSTVPNGTASHISMVLFNPAHTYQVNSRINLLGRAFVYIYGMDPALATGALNESTPRCTINNIGKTETSSVFGLALGGSPNHDIKIIGFHMHGENTTGGTAAADLSGKAKAIQGFGASGQYNIEIAHNIITDQWSASIYIRTQDNPGYDNVNIHHNAIYRSGIMSIAVSNGTNIYIDDNKMVDTTMYPVDFEDETAPCFLQNIYVRRNTIHNWAWTNAYGGPKAIVSTEPLAHTNMYIQDNVFTGIYPTTYDPNWDYTRGIIHIDPDPGYAATNVVVSGNISYVAKDGVQVVVRDTAGVTCINNQFTGSAIGKNGVNHTDTFLDSTGSTSVVQSGNTWL